jgi:hydroxyacylglutathione hydrolase
MTMLDIKPIKAFTDNYLWLFSQQNSTGAAIVDPGDAAPIMQFLQTNNLQLEAILLTHHHPDHIGGVTELLEQYKVPVYGPESKAIPQVSYIMHEGESLQVCGVRFSVLETPGHTLDHIAYYAEAPSSEQAPILFCGDTLFAGGCGRVFEGTMPMMYASLQKLAALSPQTKVYCAHEYTLGNLAFAKAMTPEDPLVQARIVREKSKREQDIPTVPTTIAEELQSNPFLRCEQEDFQAALHLQGKSPQDIFSHLRTIKDNF